MVCLPSHLVRCLSSASVVGFSGHRYLVPPVPVLASVFGTVPQSSTVVVGCAGGVDRVVRASFPFASVFHVSSFGVGRGAFARRSIAVVSACTYASAGVWVSFPAVGCPVGLLPSISSSDCFCGLGSGSWASLAFAVGSGVPCFVWLPAGVSAPGSWGFLSLGGGWWFR